MLITFLDGPANGVQLALRRTPALLRVVQAPGGSWDALDQLVDVPKPRERIHVYRRVEITGSMHVSCRPRSQSFSTKIGTYRHFEVQPDEATARDTASWQAWALARAVWPVDADAAAEGGPS